MLQEFIEAKEKGRVLYKKGLLLDTPGWSDFIELMHYKFNNPSGYPWDDQLMSHLLPNGERKATDILIYNKMDPVIFKAVEYTGDTFVNNDIKKAQPLIDYFMPLYKNFQIKALINFVGNESKYWAHKDDHDVISWHCIGQMEWRIYPHLPDEHVDQVEVMNMPYETYLLDPGDVLFCPRGIGHQVFMPEPRASLILQAFSS